jgi:hypothetical protein
MGEHATSVADVVARVLGGDAPPSWMRGPYSRTDEQADEVQNRLLSVIVNAELALETIEGPARAHVEAALQAAWNASRLVATLSLTSRLEARLS